MKSFLHSAISFGFSLPSFRLPGFCSPVGAEGGRGIRKWSPAGPEAPGALEKEGRHVRWNICHCSLSWLLLFLWVSGSDGADPKTLGPFNNHKYCPNSLHFLIIYYGPRAVLNCVYILYCVYRHIYLYTYSLCIYTYIILLIIIKSSKGHL